MTDNDIINDLSNRKQIKWKFLDNNIKQYLLNRYDDNYSSDEQQILKESYYRILNNIEKCPVCPICGNKCKFSYFIYFYRTYSRVFETMCFNSIYKRLFCSA